MKLGKVIDITIKNVGLIADELITLNKPLVCFYGEIKQGKTTILNAVKWCFGGAFPSDIIRHGETEALVLLRFENGWIRREWYVGRDGTTKARPLAMELAGAPVTKPVEAIRELLNPFLLDQDFLRNMSELERKKYFAELFAVKTPDLDTAIVRLENDAQRLRATLKGYGDIDDTKVEPPADIEKLSASRRRILDEHQVRQGSLQGTLSRLRNEYQAELNRVNALNRTIRDSNDLISRRELSQGTHLARIRELERQLASEKEALSVDTAWLTEHGTRQAELPLPSMPNTAEIEQKLLEPPATAEIDKLLSEAQAQKVRFDQYQKNLARADARSTDELALNMAEGELRELRTKRIARLKSISETCGIPGLAFEDGGNFTFEGTQAGMLSTSQLMKLSAMLSSLYPEGLGIDLIDRAESLGKSVFEFVERAKKENKTILAAIVGERPAQVPPEVGVFVIENGSVKV